jgi:DNA repair protein RecO (recombination protein O)
MLVKTDSIVLNSRKYGETSKIVALFTKEYGRVTVLAKGARKSKSKFGGGLEPMSINQAMFYMKPNRDLYLLSKVEISSANGTIYDSIESMSCGLMILESVMQTQDSGAGNIELFEMLELAIDELGKGKASPFAVFAAFQLFLAEQMGVSFDFTVSDDDIFQGTVLFSLGNGAVISNQQSGIGDSFRFNSEVFLTLLAISESNMMNIADIPMGKKAMEQIQNFFVRYFSFHMERRFVYKTYSLLAL